MVQADNMWALLIGNGFTYSEGLINTKNYRAHNKVDHGGVRVWHPSTQNYSQQ